MKEPKTSTFTPDEDASISPYQKAKAVWDERIGSATIQASNWRLIAFANTLISLACIGGMIYFGQLPKQEVEIVQVDRLGNANYVGQAGKSMSEWKPSEQQIENKLREFIDLTRSLSSDMMVVRKNWMLAYNIIADEAINLLNAESRELTPFERMKTETVNIAIEDTLRLSPDTWQVDWKEVIWSTKGVMKSEEKWRGTFKITMKTPEDKEELIKNPLGMWITHFSWSKVYQ